MIKIVFTENCSFHGSEIQYTIFIILMFFRNDKEESYCVIVYNKTWTNYTHTIFIH